jgi:hypothetical protein
MSQTLNQQRALKVAIGSRYEGPAFDRPALRQMPRHWVLEESKPRPRFVMTPDRWVAVAVALGWLFAIAQTVAQVMK